MALLVVLTFLTGCGAGNSTINTAASGGSVPSNEPTQRHVEVLRVNEYSSLRQVVRDSAAVVRVTARERLGEVPAAEDGTGPLTSTLTRVTVDHVFFSRKPVPAELTMRQTGSPAQVVEGNAELLVPGQTYVLFVTPFNFRPDRSDSTGHWITVGEIAAFREAENGFVSVAPGRGLLPAEIDYEDINAAIS